MHPFERFQHLGVGGVAALGLFAVGEAEAVKEHLRQLLGGIKVEGDAGQLHDLLFEGGNPAVQHFPEVFNPLPVDLEAQNLHRGEHLAEGQLDLPVEEIHLPLFENQPDRLPQFRHQDEQRLRPVRLELPAGQVGFAHLSEGVGFVTGREQVGGQQQVFDGHPHRRPPFKPQLVGFFGVKGCHREARSQEVGKGLLPLFGEGRNFPFAGADEKGTVGKKVADLPQFCQLFGRFRCRRVGEENDLPCPVVGRFGGGRRPLRQDGGGDRIHAVLVEEGDKLRLRPFPGQLVGGLGEGRVSADGAEVMAQKGLVLMFRNQLLNPRGRLNPVEAVENILEAPVFPDEGDGGLLADAFNARDVVGGVPHQRLDLNHLRRLYPVLLPDIVGGHQDVALVGGEVDGDRFGGQLEGVPVAGRDDTAALVLLRPAGDGTEDVVRLPALNADDGAAGEGDKLPAQRHLDPQLVRHRRAGAFVVPVHLVAEGGGMDVVSGDDGVRLEGLYKL